MADRVTEAGKFVVHRPTPKARVTLLGKIVVRPNVPNRRFTHFMLID